jgi:hypothetical protein
MNHPTHDELSEFLYDELDPPRREEVGRHVDECTACRATIESWRGVRANLAAWELPAVVRVARPAASARGGLRWAVAAAVLLGTGFGVARITEKPADLSALRTELAREVRQEVRQELAAELRDHAARQAAWQEAFQEAVVDVIGQLETRQVATYANLRKDVETVALRSHEEFNWLASYARVEDAPTGPDAPAPAVER